MSKQELHTGISEIRLWTDEVYIHIEVKSVGIWFEVIRELRHASSIDHYVMAEEIRRLYLEKKSKAQEDTEELWDTTMSQPHVQAGLERLANEAKRQYAAGETVEGGFAVEEQEGDA